MAYLLAKSTRQSKKYSVKTPTGKTIHFGATGYGDFTTHKDLERQRSYLARHSPRENWTKSGINTAGFWSRWLLWNKKFLSSSIEDVERKFNIEITT